MSPMPGGEPRLDVRFTPRELAPGDVAGKLAVVVDVLRATSSIAQGLASGARTVIPAATPEEAVLVAERIGRDRALLCGERQGIRIEGFDLGNSPGEFTPERVGGRTLVMTTTNGTLALLATTSAARTVTASFLNLSAAVRAVEEDDRPALVVCSGREGRFALEDVLLAGAIALRVRERRGGALETNDAGFAAMALAERFAERPEMVLGVTEAGRRLTAIGLADDVARCAEVDALDVLPELRERQLVLATAEAAS